MKSRIHLLLPIVFCCFSQIVLCSQTQFATQSYPLNKSNIDSLNKMQKDIGIVGGDHIAYREFHNECSALLLDGKLSVDEQRVWLLEAYIMAEHFQDTIAAYDFVAIIEMSEINIDSSMSDVIIKYLEMLSKSSSKFFSLYGTNMLSYI